MIKLKPLFLFLALLCLCTSVAALGDPEEPWSGATIQWRLENSVLKITEDCPVYSAPFESAWRPDGGAAGLYSGQSVTCLGYMQNGKWIWVEYGLPEGGKRIGWIAAPPNPGRINSEKLNTLWGFSRTPLTLEQDAAFTDDPRGSRCTVATLHRGDRIIGMTLIQDADGGLWIMAEAQVGGRPAWGFLPSDTELTEVPLFRLEGGTMYIGEGVTMLGCSAVGHGFIGSEDTDPDEWDSYSIYPELRPGDISMSLDPYGSENPGLIFSIRRVVFPASLRCLCDESILSATLDELRLDGTLKEVSPSAFSSTSIGRLTVAADYTADMPNNGEYITIGAYDVEEGNPRYCSMDGVLFTADKKTLLSYPNGKTEEHYDVPRGTEHISDWAFNDDGSLPLKTISLPIGLKTIGAYAFAGCQRLISLTVPLTVTEIGEQAFSTCISLERLSLPPWLSAGEKSKWVAFPDMTYYNGDNGETSEQPSKKDDDSEGRYVGRYAYADTETGTGDVPLYENPDDTELCGTLPAGTRVWIFRTLDGRGSFDLEDKYNQDRWISLDNLSFMSSDKQFNHTRIEIAPDAVLLKDGSPADPAWLDMEEAELHFGIGCCLIPPAYALPEEQQALLPLAYHESKYSPTVSVPFSQVTLFRSGGDGRRCAYLLNHVSTIPIPLYDAPDGKQAAHTWSGLAVELGERRNGWVQIKTPMWTRWVEEGYVWEIKGE